MSTDLVNILRNTLNPSLIESTQREIERARSSKGFATDLMIVAANINIEMNVRQSALVVLKNLLYDQCDKGNIMSNGDWDIIKQNILEALIRTWGQTKLTPTLKEIIHLIAEKDYPERWPQIVDNALNYINNPTDVNSVASSIEALKAVASVCGNGLAYQITVSNLSNRIVFPLFQLANKLFQNFSPETIPILVSIFKTFNLCIFYNLPRIFVNNIHSLMIFIKKILEIQQMQSISNLKIICLKILSRIYLRHVSATTNYNLLTFAQQFHQKYSTYFVETLLMQLMDPISTLQAINLSLSCLRSIYKNPYAESAVEIIEKCKTKIIETAINRYKVIGNFKNGQSIGSYITCIRQQRCFFIDFVTALIDIDTGILGEFINSLSQGDQKTQEISLYTFSAIADHITDIPQLHQNMCQFIVNYIMPILGNNSSSTILKARGCQIISNYIYLNLPAENLNEIFQFIYSCLTDVQQIYLNIYALEAFSKMINKYQQFIQFIIPYLQGILKKYTQLLKQSNGELQLVMNSFEGFLGDINGKQLQPFAVYLVKFLVELFYEYQNSYKNNQNNLNNQINLNGDGDSLLEEQDQNIRNASQGCLACIRQIISADNLDPSIYVELLNQCLFPLITDILVDKQLVHFQEGLNMLNLLLYKLPVPLPQKLIPLFPMFAYSLLGLPQSIFSINGLSETYKTMLSNVCVDPDEDIVQNCIGILRNYIAKLGENKNESIRKLSNQLNSSYMQEIFKIVRHVHTGYNEQKNDFIFKKGDRLVILTLYTTLLEYQIPNEMELEAILEDLVEWSKRMNNQSDKVQYYENILIAINYYGGFVFNKFVNFDWFTNELINSVQLFQYDYQIQRLVVGIAKLMEMRAFNQNNQKSAQLIRILPDILGKLDNLRRKEKGENTQSVNRDFDIEEEAQEDMIAQNTHMGLGNPQKNNQQANYQKKLEQQQEDYAKMCQDLQWDQQYNKYYYSPIENIDCIKYLGNVMNQTTYFEFLSPQDQNRLRQYLSN